MSLQFKYLKLVFRKCNPFVFWYYLIIIKDYYINAYRYHIYCCYPTRAHTRTHAHYKNATYNVTCFRTNTFNILTFVKINQS